MGWFILPLGEMKIFHLGSGVHHPKHKESDMIQKILLSIATLWAMSLPLSAQEYLVDKAHSYVGFSAKHLMITKVRGEFTDYDSKIAFDEKKKQILALEGNIKVKSIDTQNGKRDDHLRSADFFDEAKFPVLSFKMTKFESKGEGEGKLHGDLTIKGITKPVVLKAEITGPIADMGGKKRIGIELEGKIDRREFGLTWNKALESGGVLVGEEIEIKVELQAIEG